MASKKILGAKQTNISNFFSMPQQKRPLSKDAVENVSSKKFAKSENKEPGSPERKVTGDKVVLSPEQLNQIETNKNAAVERQNLKKMGVDMGSSWQNALKPEFEKEYFKKVGIHFFIFAFPATPTQTLI